MKAVVVYLILKLKEQFVKFPPEIMPCACCWIELAHAVLEITIIFNRECDIQIFFNRDVLLNGSLVDLDGTLKWSRGRIVVVQGERRQRSLAIRTEDTAGHVGKLCVKTLFSFLCIVWNCDILHS